MWRSRCTRLVLELPWVLGLSACAWLRAPPPFEPAPLRATAEPAPLRGELFDNPCIPNAAWAVSTLARDPEGSLAYRSGNSRFSFASPTATNRRLGHRQGIQRLFVSDGPDRGNYLLVSASVRYGEPGFEVVELGQLDTPGAIGFTADKQGISPHDHRVVNWITHDNRTSGTNYNHAGGLQVIGRSVAVALESYQVARPSVAGFRLWQLNPRFPLAGDLIRRRSAAPGGSTRHAGSLGIARRSDGSYVVLTFGRNAREVEVFVTAGRFLSLSEDDWISAGAWSMSGAAGTLATGSPPWWAYQNTQLVRQCDGELFLLGSARVGNRDQIDLWHVHLDPISYQPHFEFAAERHLYCNSRNTRGRKYCSFSAGAGPHVTPDGQLLFYGVEDRSCVGGGCTRGRARDGRHVGVREFASPRPVL